MTESRATLNMTDEPIRLEVSGLTIHATDGASVIVDDLSFTVSAGEVCGLVGESGSGKTSAALAMLGHARAGLRITGGTVRINGIEILRRSPRQLREVRGSLVSYVPQDPATALNPAFRVGDQLREAFNAHRSNATKEEIQTRVTDSLHAVGLVDADAVTQSYPHQLSGGQQQRVAIAMAFLCDPALIVLDEPTTGLDVTTQKQVLETLQAMCKETGAAALYVSHDLAVVAEIAHSLIVLYAGRSVEIGPSADLFSDPMHPYLAGLLEAVPVPDRPARLQGIPGLPPRPNRRGAGCDFAPRCAFHEAKCDQPVDLVPVAGREVRCVRVVSEGPKLVLAARRSLPSISRKSVAEENAVLSVSGLVASYGRKEVLHSVGLSVGPRECVAVVGESGSGKTTLARCIGGLHTAWEGKITFAGEHLTPGVRKRSLEQLRGVQYVFQNPYASLNPRWSIREIIERPLAHFDRDLSRPARHAAVVEVIEAVSLSREVLSCYPTELSGGERQRVAIARALVVGPSVLVCDEVTSALDVSVQATIVELLRRLQHERGLSLLFITHNLALVRSVAQRVAVVSDGNVVEAGLVEQIMVTPEHPYTVGLMDNVPTLPSPQTVRAATS
jgi:peptide/nickel transport system ATP-binding protein